jgi:hypothetical protein
VATHSSLFAFDQASVITYRVQGQGCHLPWKFGACVIVAVSVTVDADCVTVSVSVTVMGGRVMVTLSPVIVTVEADRVMVMVRVTSPTVDVALLHHQELLLVVLLLVEVAVTL